MKTHIGKRTISPDTHYIESTSENFQLARRSSINSDIEKFATGILEHLHKTLSQRLR